MHKFHIEFFLIGCSYVNTDMTMLTDNTLSLSNWVLNVWSIIL